jgi:3-phosphoglycerate kinase
MAKLFIEDLPLAGQRVLMRVDFNVPMRDGQIEDDTRVRASLPSIRYVLAHGASLVLMSHLGRPDGQRIARYSLAPVAERLAHLLGTHVRFLHDCVGPDVEAACAALAPGEAALLENVRFHIEEEGKVKREDGSSINADPAAVAAFRASLTALGDVYVNDAFGTAHRPNDIGVDIGETTRAMFAGVVARAGTVLWNGPMGVVEIPATAKGTLAIAQALADVTARGAITVVAGGDSVAALEQSGLTNKVTHVSTGGGASLEFLGGKELPGVAYLGER